MIRRIIRAAIVLTLVLALVPINPTATACGPYFPVTIFIQSKHPDLPLENFAGGRLGVLQPTYANSYLVAGYRYLAGGSFDASEQGQLLAIWAHHLGREAEWLKKKDAYYEWREARYLYADGVKPDPPRSDDNSLPGYKFAPATYNEFQNCADDAFLTAAKTLQARSKQFGRHSAEVRGWLDAQDTVFANCGGPFSRTGHLEVPDDAPPELPAVLRADRTYQIAAAYFYGGEWDEAEHRFRAIAQDASSPWRAIAAIVAVRTELRRITLSDASPGSTEPPEQDLSRVDTELRRLETLPFMHDVRPALWRMRGFVEFRLDPDARLLELAGILENASHRATLREDLDDFTLLLDRAEDQESLRASSPMADWLVTFRTSSQAASDHALAKWKETRSLPWLVATLSKATPEIANVSELLEAAATVQPASPAYLTVAFHRARLETQSRQEILALQTIRAAMALANAQHIPSAVNLLTALRMQLARNLDEFLRSAQRQDSLVILNIDERDLPDFYNWCNGATAQSEAACDARRSPPPLFDSDAAIVLTEKLPTSVLARAASSPSLTPVLRLQIARSAWVRSVLLNQDAISLQLVPVFSSLAPDLAPGLKAYAEASGPFRRFVAALLILHRPELHPYVSAGIGRETPPGRLDEFRDNWWCSFAPSLAQDGWGSYYSMYTPVEGPLLALYPGGKIFAPRFLTPAERESAEAEWAALSKLPAAPDWLAAQVLSFVQSSPKDARVPQALHLVVRATRLGCSDVQTRGYSKAAFQALHKLYPHDNWTQKTPYWY